MTLILNFRNEECHKSHQCFLRLVSQDNIKKIENKQMGPNKAYRLFQSKGNHKQSEKTTYRMGENICKWYIWQRINLQNIQIAHAAQY